MNFKRATDSASKMVNDALDQVNEQLKQIDTLMERFKKNKKQNLEILHQILMVAAKRLPPFLDHELDHLFGEVSLITQITDKYQLGFMRQ